MISAHTQIVYCAVCQQGVGVSLPEPVGKLICFECARAINWFMQDVLGLTAEEREQQLKFSELQQSRHGEYENPMYWFTLAAKAALH
jgi:hypothetical protein